MVPADTFADGIARHVCELHFVYKRKHPLSQDENCRESSDHYWRPTNAVHESNSGSPAVWAKIPATGTENWGSPKSACLFFQISGDANLTVSSQSPLGPKRELTKLTPYLMDIIHHKGFKTIPKRTTDGVSASPSFARFRLQNAAPRLSPAACLELAQARHRNKTESRGLWTNVRAFLLDVFSTFSSLYLEPSPRVSVILTPVGLLVYQWQLDRSDPPGQGHVRDAPRVSISVNS